MDGPVGFAGPEVTGSRVCSSDVGSRLSHISSHIKAIYMHMSLSLAFVVVRQCLNCVAIPTSPDTGRTLAHISSLALSHSDALLTFTFLAWHE